MAIRWTGQGALDMEEIIDFYANKVDPATASRIVNSIMQDIKKLATSPLVGRRDERVAPDSQQQYEFWYALGKEYRVYYRRIGPRTIRIYRVWSSRRKPLEPHEIIGSQT